MKIKVIYECVDFFTFKSSKYGHSIKAMNLEAI